MDRELAPYGKCHDKSDHKNNVYSEKYPVDYSTEVSDTKKLTAFSGSCTKSFSNLSTVLIILVAFFRSVMLKFTLHIISTYKSIFIIKCDKRTLNSIKFNEN